MIKAFFRNGERRVRMGIVGILFALLIGVVFIAWSIFAMSGQIRTLSKENNKLIEYAEVSRQRWDALQSFNPHLVVPKIVEGDSLTKEKLILPSTEEPATPTPTQSPTPTTTPRIKTVIRYRNRPTPKPTPVFHLFKSTR